MPGFKCSWTPQRPLSYLLATITVFPALTAREVRALRAKNPELCKSVQHCDLIIVKQFFYQIGADESVRSLR